MTVQQLLKRLNLKPEELSILLDELPNLRASAPGNKREAAESLFARWAIDETILTQLVDENPSLRGMLFGYVAEYQFSRIWLTHADVSYAVKPDDHNRRKKGDRVILYKGMEFSIEVKSLQTAMTRKHADGTYAGKAQCDASDRRTIVLGDGSQLHTTCLRVGEFDLLAINCFHFRGRWDFVFARNKELPRSTYRGYTPQQRSSLLASLIPVTWPPQPPFSDDPFFILDQMVKERSA